MHVQFVKLNQEEDRMSRIIIRKGIQFVLILVS